MPLPAPAGSPTPTLFAMRNLLTFTLLTGVLAFAGAGCSSGSQDDSGDLRIRCINGDSFCLVSCDLGCSQTGCSVTEIAENQRLRFVFSNQIDPASVNSASVSIRTPSGVQPDGEFLVQGRELTFVPRVRVINGVSTFGFRRNESYVITLNSGATGQGVRSTSGDGLRTGLSCTVLVSRGIQDEDQQPPSVELIAPTTTTDIPQQPTVVLRFSELIDTTALQGTLTPSSPVQFLVKGTRLEGGTLLCDSLQQGTTLGGIPLLTTETVAGRPVTVVSYTPPIQLPGESCLTVLITADVRDLSGRQGTPQQFELLVEAGTSTPITISETFSSSANQDVLGSSTVWNNGARPGLIGNDGRHGSFDVTMGTLVAPGVYEWNTDSFLIPASRSATGLEYLVTDGKFYFSDFVLPAGTTLRFTRANATSPSAASTVPPQIWVRGNAQVDGTIDVSGEDLPFWVPATGPAVGQRVSTYNGVGAGTGFNIWPVPDGQPGSYGGAGGGKGGDGGRECRNDGDVTQTIGLEVVHIYYGRDGENVQLPAGHAYAANTADTGGSGGLLHPIAGQVPATGAAVIGFIYRGYFSPGGAGGGYVGAGAVAATSGTLPSGINLATPAQPGGLTLPSLLPIPGGATSLNHFLVGGSGGGGGGSHAYGTRTIIAGEFVAGAGGTGGGGAFALRVGGDLSVGPTAQLIARGGDGVLINGDDPSNNNPTPPLQPTYDVNYGVTSPGGGGSGGSILLQSGRTLVFEGTMDVRGGAGSRTGSISIATTGAPVAFNIVSQAGSGAPGFYRLESGVGAPSFSGTVSAGTPAYVAGTNGGTLTDRDTLSGGLSKWRAAGTFFPPTWLRYELDVDLDGDGTIDITYTDSGAPGTQRANDPNGPVQIRFQGATLNQAGTEPVGQPSAWRDGIGNGAGPGIVLDSVNGFRFQLLFNRDASATTVVRGLRVFAQS